MADRTARARSALGSWDVVVIVALALVVLVGGLTIDGVASPRFWRFVTLEVIPIALIALPMTLIVITGEIDLSVASTLGLTCVVMGQLWVSGVTSLPLIVALCLLLGAVLLTTIGAALPVLGIDPFWQRAAVGVLILAAIGLDRALGARLASSLKGVRARG